MRQTYFLCFDGQGRVKFASAGPRLDKFMDGSQYELTWSSQVQGRGPHEITCASTNRPEPRFSVYTWQRLPTKAESLRKVTHAAGLNLLYGHRN